MAVNPLTGDLSLDACYASGWADELEGRITAYLDDTGLTGLETDGPYGGAPCAASHHEHHRGLADSVYFQTRLQERFYHRMRARGVYLHAPDFYGGAGANKIMNYGDPVRPGVCGLRGPRRLAPCDVTL